MSEPDRDQHDQPENEAECIADVELAENERQKETGGRDGPEPTRFGDWEKNGRCIDF